MKERPILFSTPMVRAILEGRKNQTRRIIKIPDLIKMPDRFHYIGNSNDLDICRKAIPYDDRLYHEFQLTNSNGASWVIHSYKPGDILWVRETWRPKMHNFPIGWPYDYKATAKEDCVPQDGPWKPSIFMPKVASRLKLKVTNIRVERVQDITEEDAKAEGCERAIKWIHTGKIELIDESHVFYKHSIYKDGYEMIWNKINGKGSWQSNPWVWVIEFGKI